MIKESNLAHLHTWGEKRKVASSKMYFQFKLFRHSSIYMNSQRFFPWKKIHTFGGSISHRQLMKECVMYFGEVYNMGLIELQHNWLWMPFPFVSQKNLWYNHLYLHCLPKQKKYAWFEGNSEIYSKWKNLKDHSIIVALLLLLYAGFGIGQGLSRIPEKFFHICPKRPPQGKPL